MKIKLEVVLRDFVEVEVPGNVSEEEVVELLDSCPMWIDELPTWCYVDADDILEAGSLEVVDGEIED